MMSKKIGNLNQQLVISVHIPKVAGTTFRGVLKKHFGKTLLADYRAPHPSHKRLKKYDLDSEQVVLEQGIRCVHGHFKVKKYLHFENSQFITWVRDPMERIPSQYNFLRTRHPQNRHLPSADCSLLEFSQYRSNRNQMSAYLAGKDLSDFAFIGVVEYFDQCLDALEENTGIKRPAVVEDRNRNPSKPGGNYQLDELTRRRIYKHNEKDFDLYSDICRLYGFNQKKYA